MATKIAVCLEVGREATGAFAPEHPGCWVFGKTTESALIKMKIAIAEWFEWMKKHGEPVTPPGDFDVEIVEMMKVDYNPVESGKPEPLFWSEVASITREDITKTIRLLTFSREDLLNLVSNVDRKCLDWLPPGKPRTIRNCLRHIARVEPWYITRLNVELPNRYPRDVFEMLAFTRNLVINFLKNFPKEKMRGVFQPEKDRSPKCNLWTARKVLRRLVDHERLHTKYIERVLQIYRRAK
jgi:predicted RNase H-like HicB family nuclease